MATDSRSDSSIRVLVDWDSQAVFSGEEVKCTITFRNASTDLQSGATTPTAHNPPTPQFQNFSPPHHQRQPSRSSTLSLLDRARNVQNSAARKGSISQPATPSRAHRTGFSLSIPGSAHSRTGSVQWQGPTPALPAPVVPHSGHGGRSNNSHRRSVSIMSMGSTAGAPGIDGDMDVVSPRRSGRLSIGQHSRAASLQISPISMHHPNSANVSPRTQTPPYSRNGHRSPQSHSPYTPRSPVTSPGALPDFRFPNATSPLHEVHNSSDDVSRPDSLLSPRTAEDIAAFPATPKSRTSMGPPPIPQPPHSSHSDNPGFPAAKVISAQSLADTTPRSSTELYALSNNSSETLASEYPGQSFGRNGGRPGLGRRQSTMGQRQQQTEVLMMGFAQLQGSFTLDGS